LSRVWYINDHHQKCGEEEHFAATEFVNQEGGTKSNNPTPNTESTVDFELLLLIGDTDLIENFGEVIGDNSVAGPLREETKCDKNYKTMTITFGLEKFKDTILGEFLFEGESSFNFSLNKLYRDVIFIIKGKVMGENLEGSVRSILLDIPTRRFSTS